MYRIALNNQGGHDGLRLNGLPVRRATVALHHRHLGEAGSYERIVGVTDKREDRR
jgi:hypothetical protein